MMIAAASGRRFDFVKIEKLPYDGDTIVVAIDQGFSQFRLETVRMARINTPEVTGPEKSQGLISRDRLRSLLPVGQKVQLVTYKNGEDKYGRYLADVYVDGVCINDLLVREGLAVYKEY